MVENREGKKKKKMRPEKKKLYIKFPGADRLTYLVEEFREAQEVVHGFFVDLKKAYTAR